MADKHIYRMIDNYIYLYHTKTFIVLPTYPDSLNDQMSVSFAQSSPMARSSPIFSYSNSGPRSMQFTFTLHRDMMKQINYDVSNAPVTLSDDYIDILVNQIQACAVPAYNASSKLVDPPMVAVRVGEEVFIKGVVNGSVGVTYDMPILDNGKYAFVQVSFNVSEVDPYDAQTLMRAGSFRGLTTDLERNTYRF